MSPGGRSTFVSWGGFHGPGCWLFAGTAKPPTMSASPRYMPRTRRISPPLEADPRLPRGQTKNLPSPVSRQEADLTHQKSSPNPFDASSGDVRFPRRVIRRKGTAVALPRDGWATATGKPRPLDLALFMREFEAEVRAPFVPAAFVRAVTASLAWLARCRGFDSHYPRSASRAPQSRRDSRRPRLTSSSSLLHLAVPIEKGMHPQ